MNEEPTIKPSKKIQHSSPGFNAGGPGPTSSPLPTGPDPAPLPVADPTGPDLGPKKISTFGEKQRHEDTWSRTPNTTGKGAIHVKSFHCKLTDDALRYMDQMINEWLDAHPQYEVKIVSSTVGTLSGKLKEPNLVCQVWV